MDPTERLAKLDEVLDSYEFSLGLPHGEYPHLSEVSQYINYGRAQLEALSQQDAGGVAYILTSYSIFLQIAINREKARISWAESLIKECVIDKLDSYSGYSYLEKFGKAVKDNEYTVKLSQIQRFAQERADRLNFIANGVNNLATILTNIMRLRRE